MRLGTGHPAYAKALAHKGILQFHKGDVSKAIETMQNAQNLVTSKRVSTKISREMAVILLTEGQLVESEYLFERVLNSYKESLGVDHPDYAQTLIEYSKLLEAKGLHERARKAEEDGLNTFRFAFNK